CAYCPMTCGQTQHLTVEDFIYQFGSGLRRMDHMPLGEARTFYDQLCQRFAGHQPTTMRVMDGHVGTVAIRRFIPAATGGSCIVYAHGGGFQIGSLDSHHGVAASLAKLTSKEVISVDYRLAPEVGYDDMLTDCMQVIAAL